MGRSERNTWTERITARAWVRSNTVAGRLVRVRLSRVFRDEEKRREGMRAGIDAARRHGQPRSATRIARRFIWRATWDASTHEGCASAVRGTVARESESESETKKEDATRADETIRAARASPSGSRARECANETGRRARTGAGARSVYVWLTNVCGAGTAAGSHVWDPPADERWSSGQMSFAEILSRAAGTGSLLPRGKSASGPLGGPGFGVLRVGVARARRRGVPRARIPRWFDRPLGFRRPSGAPSRADASAPLLHADLKMLTASQLR